NSLGVLRQAQDERRWDGVLKANSVHAELVEAFFGFFSTACGRESPCDIGFRVWSESRHYRRADHSRICPSPKTMNFVVVSSSRPMGPKAWILLVLMPISAPKPSSPPSLNRVDALTITAD